MLTQRPSLPNAAPYSAAAYGGFFHSVDQGMSDEADFSAEQSGACTPPRLPRPDGDGRRPQGAGSTPRPWPQEAVGLTPLTQRRDFLAANTGKRAPTTGFVLLVRDRNDGDAAKRVGYTVTKKIGNAVVRNRMKRRLRALAREVLEERGVSGADHVLIGRMGGIERPYADLRADLLKALARVAR
jgi:ribonuclease P protein component